MGHRYYVGQGVVAHAEFYDPNGALINPTTVTIRIKKPDGTTTSSTSLTHPGTGVYEYVIDTTGGPAGDWWWRIEGTGAAVGANEDTFTVLKSQVL